MNDNARKWLEALRSGNYKQGCGYLNKDGSFCCLGVACDLYAQENDVEISINSKLEFYYNRKVYVLPIEVTAWLGLQTNSGSYANGDESLVNHNDTDKTFSEIADIIESEPEGLFV